MEIRKQRAEFVDIAKGIAIICIIIGHTWSNYCSIDKRLAVFIYSFHMPLFFILSGWCLKTTDVDIKFTLIKKVRQLVVPYVLINVIRYLLMRPAALVKKNFWRSLFYAFGGDGQKGLDGTPVHKIGMTWFLMALFACQILYLLLKKISEEYEISMWILVIGFAMLAVQLKEYTWLPLGIHAGMYGMLFYHVGYVMKEKQVFEKELRKLPAGSIIVGFCVWMACARWGGVGMHKVAYAGALSVVGPVCGTYFVVKFSQYIYAKLRWIGKILAWCGKFSLYIYAIRALDIVGLAAMKNMVLQLYALPSRKGALLFCVIRVAIVLICSVTFVTAKNWLFRIRKREQKLVG